MHSPRLTETSGGVEDKSLDLQLQVLFHMEKVPNALFFFFLGENFVILQLLRVQS